MIVIMAIKTTTNNNKTHLIKRMKFTLNMADFDRLYLFQDEEKIKH